jgi:hypothetical protein
MTLPTASPNFFASRVIEDLLKNKIIFLKVKVLSAVVALHFDSPRLLLMVPILGLVF